MLSKIVKRSVCIITFLLIIFSLLYTTYANPKKNNEYISYCADWDTLSLTSISILDNDIEYRPNEVLPDFSIEDPDYTIEGDYTDSNGTGGELNSVLEIIKSLPLWQLLTIILSIILNVTFLAIGGKYTKKRKKIIEEAHKYSKNLAVAIGFLGISMTTWTIIAMIFMVLSVFSLMYMLKQISKYKKQIAIDEQNKLLESQNKDENCNDIESIQSEEQDSSQAERKKEWWEE